jgi:ADP-ribosylglycohydrolase
MTGTRDTQTAHGIFLGAAAGDALGWPQEARGGLIGGQKERDRAAPQLEFRSWGRHAGSYSRYAQRYRDPVQAGEYSDDTQLLLATARSCLAGEKWWERLTGAELPAWPLYQRGGGRAVLTAASLWAAGRQPWRNDRTARSREVMERYRGAGANGVAMRIAPHVLWARDSADLISRVVRDGITTHGHPRALVGALVYAFALAHAASSPETTHGYGESIEAASGGLIDADRVLPLLPRDWGSPGEIEEFSVTWAETNKETSQLLALIADSLRRGAMSNPEETLERLGCTDPKVNGSGIISAVAAVYLASRYAARPQDGLLSAAFLRNGDTDTLAALTAAVLGALHGTHWLGNLASGVQDAGYISQLAARTAARVPDPPPWPTSSPRQLRRTLTTALNSRRGTDGEFPDGRYYHVDQAAVLEGTRILRAWLHLADGQTVLVDLPAEQRPTAPADTKLPRDGIAPRERVPEQNGGADTKTAGRETPAADEASQAHRVPASAQSSRRPSASVTLATRSLSRSASFYAQLTGRDIPVRGDTAEITPWLLLHQHATDTPIDALSVMVSITVDDISAAKRRLGIGTATDSRPNATTEVRDPDGRVVRISQHPASPGL